MSGLFDLLNLYVYDIEHQLPIIEHVQRYVNKSAICVYNESDSEILENPMMIS